jgi:CubicO group peptidase (beta-lactamase class C family)
MQIFGECDARFEAVKDVLAASIESGGDIGASFAVYEHGKKVVDIWGGYLDEERTQLWQEDTIVNVYSTTKTMSFLCAMLLAERGQLDFDANVADYWPEFAQNGKESVKVWHFLDHAAGLSGTDEPLEGADVYDWDRVVNALAAQAPWWEPGRDIAYHALTQGFLIGELVRRITGKTLGQFFAEEIAGPLDADFYIGVPESEFGRIGDLFPSAEAEVMDPDGDPDSILRKTFRYPVINALDSRTEGWRKAEIPAANGHGNARSVAKIHSVLANKGEALGVKLFSEPLATDVMNPRIEGIDMALQVPMSYGLGFGINKAKLLSQNDNVCFWGGWGGSLALIDQDTGISMSYVMNKMFPGLVGDMRSFNLVQAVYQGL